VLLLRCRDVKSSNVLLAADGATAKLADFGSAMLVGPPHTSCIDLAKQIRLEARTLLTSTSCFLVVRHRWFLYGLNI
jgi:serine/threonine protein kinase